jgi:hypothetical protein
MPMAKTAVMIRLSDAQLAQLDARAAHMGRSRASVALLAVLTYLERPSLLEAPMADLPERGPLPPAPEGALRARVAPDKVAADPVPPPPTIAVLKEQLRAKERLYRIDTSGCTHKYRDRVGTCLGCGHNR